MNDPKLGSVKLFLKKSCQSGLDFMTKTFQTFYLSAMPYDQLWFNAEGTASLSPFAPICYRYDNIDSGLDKPIKLSTLWNSKVKASSKGLTCLSAARQSCRIGSNSTFANSAIFGSTKSSAEFIVLISITRGFSSVAWDFAADSFFLSAFLFLSSNISSSAAKVNWFYDVQWAQNG